MAGMSAPTTGLKESKIDMSPAGPITARAIAADVLTLADPRKANVVNMLTGRIKETNEPQRATDLVLGVVKNRSLIDTIVEKASDVPVERITPKILNILRVAIYELVYCPLTPAHAIVSEAVENAKSIAGKKQIGFVNAVLRNATRHIQDRQSQLTAHPSQRLVPQDLQAGCRFDMDLLADPAQYSIDYFAGAFSLPNWLVADWLKTFGIEQTQQICFASNRRPGIYLRPNTLRTTVDELVAKLRSEQVQCELVAELNMIKVTSPGAITELPGFSQGLFTVQDISSSQPVRLLQPEPDWSILDLCAAPGTKTTQLVEATAGRAEIFATDIDSERLDVLRQGLNRLGFSENVKVIDLEELQAFVKNRQTGFDCVLLDVPCSNTGVLAKRPEVRYRLTKKAIEDLAKTQLDLLCRAKEFVKPAGVICYSTCSIEACENNMLVERFLNGNAGFELKLEKLTLPSAQGFDHDGGYTAVIAGRAG